MIPFPTTILTTAMTALFAATSLIAVTSPGAAFAAPNVVADIAPIHGLAAAVTKGVDGAPTPTLLVGGGASPHSYSMKPSEAEALNKAEIVIWAGPALAPWLGRAIETLAPDAKSLDLSMSDGLRLLPARDDPRFAHDDSHDGGHDGGHDHGHSHGHGHKHGEHHDKSGGEAFDPHFWLDPENAKVILDTIAAALATQDPANADAYRRNAAEAKTAIDDAARDVEAALAPVKGRRFVVMHDAFHYFEDRFGMEAEGALSLSDGASPGPRQMEEIRNILREGEVVCVFGEPQSPQRLAAAVVEGTEVKIAELDPISADLPPTSDHYPQLLRRLASSMAACLAR